MVFIGGFVAGVIATIFAFFIVASWEDEE